VKGKEGARTVCSTSQTAAVASASAAVIRRDGARRRRRGSCRSRARYRCERHASSFSGTDVYPFLWCVKGCRKPVRRDEAMGDTPSKKSERFDW
jgi:hypothetical protein